MLLPFHQQKTSFHRGIFRNVAVRLLRFFHIVPYFPKKYLIQLCGVLLATEMMKVLEIPLHKHFSFTVPIFVEKRHSENFRNISGIYPWQRVFNAEVTSFKLYENEVSSWDFLWLLCKLMDWFLYHRDFRHEWVKLQRLLLKIQWKPKQRRGSTGALRPN